MFCRVEPGLGAGLVGSRVAYVVKKRLGWMGAVLLQRCLWCEVVLGRSCEASHCKSRSRKGSKPIWTKF